MYLFMFIAAWHLKKKFAHLHRPFAIPGGNIGYYLTCIAGLFGCLITLIVGFIPPAEAINIGGAGQFRLIFTCGILIMTIPAFLLYLLRNRKVKRALNNQHISKSY
jgi:hypothetical protein